MGHEKREHRSQNRYYRNYSHKKEGEERFGFLVPWHLPKIRHVWYRPVHRERAHWFRILAFPAMIIRAGLLRAVCRQEVLDEVLAEMFQKCGQRTLPSLFCTKAYARPSRNVYFCSRVLALEDFSRQCGLPRLRSSSWLWSRLASRIALEASFWVRWYTAASIRAHNISITPEKSPATFHLRPIRFWEPLSFPCLTNSSNSVRFFFRGDVSRDSRERAI